jgi:hypothetical protein
MTPAEHSEAAATKTLKCELAAEVLRSFGTLRFAATGWSMLPSVWPGETLVVDRIEPGQVRLGDLVLIGRDGGLCAHRIIGTLGDSQNPQWITQGDAMRVPDRPVAANELLGRVAYLIRGGKLVAVPAEIGVIDRLIAKVVRRFIPAARALVYLHGVYAHGVRLQRAERTSEESVSCQN